MTDRWTSIVSLGAALALMAVFAAFAVWGLR